MLLWQHLVGPEAQVMMCHYLSCYFRGLFFKVYNFSWVTFATLRRTTWAEEKKLNMETFGVPGRFLRGRGFRGRGRGGQSTTEQRPLPKIGSGRVWRLFFFFFVFFVNSFVNIVVFYLFKRVPPLFPPIWSTWSKVIFLFFFPNMHLWEFCTFWTVMKWEINLFLIMQLYARNTFIYL